MRLLLIIIGVVLSGYVFFKTFRRKTNRRNVRIRDDFGQTVMERDSNPNKPSLAYESKTMGDPLLDDYGSTKIEINTDQEDVVVFDDQDQAEIIDQVSKPYLQRSDVEESEAEYHESHFAKEKTSVSSFHEQEEQTHEVFEDDDNITPINEFISITIMPKGNAAFSGKTLLTALVNNHFHYGKQKIFHRHINDNPHQPSMFSVASIVEPGFFTLDNMENNQFPGIVLFMVLPCAYEAMTTFDKMLANARQLAAFLNGELCDYRRNQLTAQTIQHYRDIIKENRRAQFSQHYGFQRET